MLGPLLFGGLLISGCNSEASDTTAAEQAAAEPKGSSADAAILGPVNRDRPDWLPADFPLPADAHIYDISGSDVSSPKIFQIKARTLADRETIMADVTRWAETRGLHPVDEGKGKGRDVVGTFKILSFDGASDSPSVMQVSDEGGRYRRITLTVVGPPWGEPGT